MAKTDWRIGQHGVMCPRRRLPSEWNRIADQAFYIKAAYIDLLYGIIEYPRIIYLPVKYKLGRVYKGGKTASKKVKVT
jgi:hypothetical protein